MKTIAKILLNLFLFFLLCSINVYATKETGNVTLSGNFVADVTTTTDCSCNEQELVNGSFETSKKVNNRYVPTGWLYKGDFIRTTDYKVCGSYSALLTGSGSFHQDSENIVPASVVTLNIWGGYHNYQKQTFFLTFLGANDIELLVVSQKLNKYVSQAGGKLTQYTLTGVAPEGTLKVRIAGTSEGNYFKVDNACLEIVKPVISCDDCFDNKLQNPSFEQTETSAGQQVPVNWIGNNFIKDAGYSICDAKNGLINSGGGSFHQDVVAAPGSSVNLKIWGGYHANRNHKFELQFFGESGSQPISTVSVDLDKSVDVLNGKLKMYKLDALSPAGTAYVRVRGSASGDYFKVDAACLTIRGGTLPVKLIGFKGVVSEDKVRLDWQTSSETNSSEFEIQHSTSGKTWQALSQVAAKGESEAVVKYDYTHTSPTYGENLYRLKMIDIDGTYTYSSIVSVKQGNGVIVTVFPNPTTDYVSIKSSRSDISSVVIYNADGGMVKNVPHGQLDKIDLRGLSSGSYFLRMYDSAGSVTTKRIELKK